MKLTAINVKEFFYIFEYYFSGDDNAFKSCGAFFLVKVHLVVLISLLKYTFIGHQSQFLLIVLDGL